MIFVDDILTYFRSLGHAAEYGTLAQLNEQLTNVDYAASTDGMVAFVRLIGEQRTVDGYDQCDIAVHLSWLCPLDFDGETMLSTQEQAKDTLKAWINHLRGGNTVTVSDDARWQFGYDDFAENVAWVAVRVTLTAAAADCVPLSPEPPTPPPGPEYEYICPQVLHYSSSAGYPNPAFNWRNNRTILTIAIPMEIRTEEGEAFPLVIGHFPTNSWSTMGLGIIDEQYIQTAKNALSSLSDDRKMKPETEKWLRDRLGWECATRHLFSASGQMQEEFQRYMIAGSSALHCEKKEIYYIP